MKRKRAPIRKRTRTVRAAGSRTKAATTVAAAAIAELEPGSAGKTRKKKSADLTKVRRPTRTTRKPMLSKKGTSSSRRPATVRAAKRTVPVIAAEVPLAPATKHVSPETKPAAATPARAKSAAPPLPVTRENDPEKSLDLRAPDISPAQPPVPTQGTPESTSKQLGTAVPAILLEGDEPSLPQATGPGRKFASGPQPVTRPAELVEAALPEAYGTGRLWLVARDPHCLYAHWDLTAQQQRECNAQSVHQHLLVRVYQNHANGRPLNEIHVHPESRHWFIHVELAGATYIAELGFYPKDGHWHRISLSERVATPAATRAEPGPAQFATMTFESPRVFGAHRTQVPEPSAGTYFHRPVPGSVETAQAPSNGQVFTNEERPTGAPHVTPALLPSAAPLRAWTEAQTQIVADLSGWTVARTEWLDSIEITRLVEDQVAIPRREEIGRESLLPSSLEAAIFSPAPELPGEVSSPFGGQVPSEKQFWFNVNAELVVYGATEPDAQVTIGGRPIRLRPDGTFSYRFALPDGTYDLPIEATAAHGDSRQAHLHFHRGTSYSGQVGVHPQDPSLRTPDPRHVA